MTCAVQACMLAHLHGVHSQLQVEIPLLIAGKVQAARGVSHVLLTRVCVVGLHTKPWSPSSTHTTHHTQQQQQQQLTAMRLASFFTRGLMGSNRATEAGAPTNVGARSMVYSLGSWYCFRSSPYSSSCAPQHPSVLRAGNAYAGRCADTDEPLRRPRHQRRDLRRLNRRNRCRDLSVWTWPGRQYSCVTRHTHKATHTAARPHTHIHTHATTAQPYAIPTSSSSSSMPAAFRMAAMASAE